MHFRKRLGLQVKEGRRLGEQGRGGFSAQRRGEGGRAGQQETDGPEGWDEAEVRALGLLGVARSQA